MQIPRIRVWPVPRLHFIRVKIGGLTSTKRSIDLDRRAGVSLLHVDPQSIESNLLMVLDDLILPPFFGGRIEIIGEDSSTYKHGER